MDMSLQGESVIEGEGAHVKGKRGSQGGVAVKLN